LKSKLLLIVQVLHSIFRGKLLPRIPDYPYIKTTRFYDLGKGERFRGNGRVLKWSPGPWFINGFRKFDSQNPHEKCVSITTLAPWYPVEHEID
jgi:hypothetical protein